MEQALLKTSPEIRLVLISDSDVTAVAKAALEKYSAYFTVFPSLEAFFRSPEAKDVWTGFLVGAKTKIKMSQADKLLLKILDSIYPVCMFRPADNEHGIACFTPRVEIDNDIDAFLSYCKEIAPRPIRVQQRYGLNLPVVLSLCCEGNVTNLHDEKTFSVNTSMGGMFVATNQIYEIGDKVEMEISMLGDDFLIKAEVRWVRPWCKDEPGIPGIGVQFLDVSDGQISSLEGLLCGAPVINAA